MSFSIYADCLHVNYLTAVIIAYWSILQIYKTLKSQNYNKKHFLANGELDLWKPNDIHSKCHFVLSRDAKQEILATVSKAWKYLINLYQHFFVKTTKLELERRLIK